MTKLTKEQIEQERVKFETWYRKSMSPDAEMRKTKDGVYVRFWQRDSWTSWLARAELDKEE